MITKVVLAKLSPTMEEGTIVRWAKQEGDAIKVGDVLAEIETDKANMEMEALAAGVLRKILVPAGGTAPTGALIGVIADTGEDIAPILAQAKPAPVAKPKSTAPAAPTPPAPQALSPTAPAAPTPPTVAIAVPAPAPPGPAGRVKASPLARAMANQRNIPLHTVAGTGPGGRVVKRDIDAYVTGALGIPVPMAEPVGAPRIATTAGIARPAAAVPSLASAAPAPPGVVPGQEIPLSSMRRTIAKRLVESKFSAPHFYLSMEVDMGPAVELREQLQRGENVKISFNDLVVKACAKSLVRFPLVNASWAGDKILTHAAVHVGVAVAVPDGLITPVVRDADRKSVLDISREVKDLASRARDRKLRPDEYVGSTFTISNLGMYDVAQFTAIINPPESAILAVGTVRKEAVVAGEAIRIGHRMTLTLSCDHRVVDGALGAQFLGELRRLLENPASLFV